MDIKAIPLYANPFLANEQSLGLLHWIEWLNLVLEDSAKYGIENYRIRLKMGMVVSLEQSCF